MHSELPTVPNSRFGQRPEKNGWETVYITSCLWLGVTLVYSATSFITLQQVLFSTKTHEQKTLQLKFT